MSGNLVLRTATPDDARERAELIAAAFLGDLDDETFASRELIAEPDRAHVVTDEARIVATAAILSREMTVPGAVVPAAHVSAVVVAPTHRRRGLLSRLMSTQLQAVRDQDTEPIAALWATEGGIYGRYGYGLACWHVEYQIPTSVVRVPGATPLERLRMVTPSAARDELAAVLDRARVERPGLSSRPGGWWEHITRDDPSARHGMSALRGVLYETGGRAEGYALWRVKEGWEHTGPVGEVIVTEVVAETTDAYAALWRFLLSIDLTRTVKYRYAAPDEPLPYIVTDGQALGASTRPALWVRVVDVAAALSRRRYAAPVDVVLEVADERMPHNAGRWQLVGDVASAKCVATEAAPDFSLDVRELGSVYLGGVSLATLAAAGQVVEHRPGAVAAASAAFGWHRQPVSIEVF